VHADEASAWDSGHERFEVKRINYQEAYGLDGACTHMAEEYVSRLRGAEIGIHLHIAGSHLLRYAQESAWCEDYRKVSNGDQVNRIAALVLKRGKSINLIAISRGAPADALRNTLLSCRQTRRASAMSAPERGSRVRPRRTARRLTSCSGLQLLPR
jgi:ISXO2 transposase-like protein